MSTMKQLKRIILAFCLVGVTVFASSCNVNQPISTHNEKGYGGDGGGR
ncbi:MULTISPECIES: hypothetical protein [Legionella]|uniref:Lipoprotein n=1 Tax=Legionella resiliens TaxID=2905958 RepID=A0ABS8X0G4_9GAMM|nr:MULTISPECIES: hypothetical protein [unclassified Legionella]MCE0721968.1 hypothetical protein [Legionella sp. 9fVS26]MCE3531122.1 hypothetical protein [Legionella sp. 8cVS16]QLZ70710.1 hypothetical protein FOLKNPGA_03527 [Legionella sp. PC1000]